MATKYCCESRAPHFFLQFYIQACTYTANEEIFLFSGCFMLRTTTEVVSQVTEETPLDMWLQQQQVVIYPVDLFPGDRRGKKGLSALSDVARLLNIFICCHCWERCTCISTNNIVFIRLVSDKKHNLQGRNNCSPPLSLLMTFSSVEGCCHLPLLLSFHLNLGHAVSLSHQFSLPGL